MTTVYDQRLRYQAFDVTDLLQPGRNALGAILADGWYRGRLGFGGGRRNIYGEQLALLAQLEVQYVDGSSERIVSDEHWRAATGAILASSIYDGESYDARLEHTRWATAGFDETGWSAVRVLEQDISVLADMTRTGWFECSDQLLNRLHENVVWGMRGNFLDVPTDCPQRDERLGWTGDL